MRNLHTGWDSFIPTSLAHYTQNVSSQGKACSLIGRGSGQQGSSHTSLLSKLVWTMGHTSIHIVIHSKGSSIVIMFSFATLGTSHDSIIHICLGLLTFPRVSQAGSWHACHSKHPVLDTSLSTGTCCLCTVHSMHVHQSPSAAHADCSRDITQAAILM